MIMGALLHNEKVIDFIYKKFQIENFLGKGDHGCAFKTKDNKVVKATLSWKEALAAKKLIGKKSNYLSEIYSVTKLTINITDIYIIVLEYLEPLQVEEIKLVKEVSAVYEMFSSETYEHSYGKFFKKEMKDFPALFEKILNGELKEYLNPIEFENYNLKELRNIVIQFSALMKEAKKYKLFDVHINNIGKKNGILAAYDLMLTDANPDKLDKIPVHESSFLIESILFESQVEKYMDSELGDRIKNKYGVAKFIGEGSDGLAFLTKDDKVLKLTPNEHEAILAYKLKGKNFKHYTNVYEVRKFSSSKIEGRSVFVILMEFLQPLSEEEIFIFEMCPYLEGIFEHKDSFEWKEFKNMTNTEILNYLRQHNISYLLKDRLNKEYGTNNKVVLQAYNEYIELKNELKNELKKFQVRDIHSGNLGRKENGNLAAYDLLLGRDVVGSIKSIKSLGKV